VSRPILRILMGAPLLLAYVALTGSAHPGNVALGALVTAAVLAMLPAPAAGATSRGAAATLGAGLRFAATLAVDVVKCGVQVAVLVMKPSMPIRPGILAVPSGCRTKAGLALSAYAITVTPGELVVEIGRDGTLYVHCLDLEASRSAADAEQVRRCARLEGPAPAPRTAEGGGR
jgi:multicomponent Na+:H+ antiporter subunit E